MRLVFNPVTGNLDTVNAPATSTDNAIARYDGTSGNIQNSEVTIDDSGNIVLKDVGDGIYQGASPLLQTRLVASNVVIGGGLNNAAGTAASNIVIGTITTGDGLVTGGIGNFVGGAGAAKTCNSQYGVAIGYNAQAGKSLGTRNDNNVNIGSYASYLATGAQSNVVIGDNAAYGDAAGFSGDYNLVLGGYAGRYLKSRNYNVLIGPYAGTDLDAEGGLSTGSNNLVIGSWGDYFPGGSLRAGSNNIILGASAGPTSDVSNKLYIDITQSDYPLIYGEMDNQKVNLVRNAGATDHVHKFTQTDYTSAGYIKATQFRLSALNTAPSSASDTGTAGEIRIDASNIYVCTATNTWKKAAIATW